MVEVEVLALALADVSRDVNARGRRRRDLRHGHCCFRLGFGIEDCDQSGQGKRVLVRVLELISRRVSSS
jgi:hypothetical protein